MQLLFARASASPLCLERTQKVAHCAILRQTALYESSGFACAGRFACRASVHGVTQAYAIVKRHAMHIAAAKLAMYGHVQRA